MVQAYHQAVGCTPSQHEDVYIFAIAPVANRGLAAITSADELLLLNRDTLTSSGIPSLAPVPKGLTSLVIADQGQTAICAGNDGTLAVFDLRTASKVAQYKSGQGINTIACRNNDIAIGGDSVVSIWDRRQKKIRWQNTEINDEVTALDFHASRDNIILTGGDDGVVSVFDTHVQEEQDSLLQAVNHGPIHKAGFLGPENLYALSSDQNLALHSLTIDDVGEETSQTPPPNQLGDLRPIVPCEYVIDVLQSGQDYVVACGSHSHSRIDLIKIDRGRGLDDHQRIVLEGAHGEDIVRFIYVDDENGTVFTAGEDGQIAAFRLRSTIPPTTPIKAAKSKQGSDIRYKPY